MKTVLLFVFFLVYTQAQLSIYRGPGKECIDEEKLDQTEVYKLLHRTPMPVNDVMGRFWSCIWKKGNYLNEDNSLNVTNLEKFLHGIYVIAIQLNDSIATEYAKKSIDCCKKRENENLVARIIDIMNCVHAWRPNTVC